MTTTVTAPACRWPHLLDPIAGMLPPPPGAVDEFRLIRALQARGDLAEFPAEGLATPLALYRTHFVLFHCLHHLDAALGERGEALEIHCLRIRRLARPAEGRQRPGFVDPMRSFYLDGRNLDDVDTAQVERLLGDFWRRFARRDGRAEALAELGLEDPVTDAEIRQVYRRLMMRHHPDRGGDTATVQRLNDAVARLL
ncbi:DNA-J related domain-containing protein [Spiribacter halobius]|nr:DNA-J related domain-containing protein [Spiribacter halobius]UEX78291.1 molecular chaperone DnaJ [Spiribacter halobius]